MGARAKTQSRAPLRPPQVVNGRRVVKQNVPAVISSNATMYRIRVPTAKMILRGQTGRICVPAGIADLTTFRRWAHSLHFPELGRIDFLGKSIWVDLSMEEYYTHNSAKTDITAVLQMWCRETRLGRFASDRMRFSYPVADASVEPDGTYFSYDSLRNGRLREVSGAKGGVMEFEGTMDMVLEIVSPSSVKKDYKALPKYYARAKVAEFWRVDVREEMKFEIFQLAGRDYRRAAVRDGWQKSRVFDRWFRLVVIEDEMGKPDFRLDVRVK